MLTQPKQPTSDNAVAVVQVSGDVDLATEPRLRAELHQVLGRVPPRVVVDLGRVDFFGARGLAMLLAAEAEASRAGGSLTLVDVPPAVLRVMTLTGTDRQFRVRPDVRQALVDLERDAYLADRHVMADMGGVADVGRRDDRGGMRAR